MSKSYLLPQLKFYSNGKANANQIVLGNKYRITILTDRFFRFEYSESNSFVDLPSQVFWYRKQQKPHFTVSKYENEDSSVIEIKTKFWTICYKESQPFSEQTLKIYDDNNNVYYHGYEYSGNLKGTARTLDRTNGQTDLEDGLFSTDGFVIIDDSKSLLFLDYWLVTRELEQPDFYFFGYHDDYKKGLYDFYQIAGHTAMIPRYILGNWWSRYWNYQESELLEVVDRFNELDIPLSVLVIDMDWHLVNIDPKYGSGWTGYTWNKANFPNPKDFLKKLKERKLFSSLNLHPALGFRAFEDQYEMAADFMGVSKSEEEPVLFDCSSQKFMNIYFQIHHQFEEDGLDFWWIDWQQGNKSKLSGLDPLYSLNHLHFLDSKKHENKRGFIFSRWPGLGGHRYPIGFSGDTQISWESLDFQPYFTLTAANVGFGWWSHDIGGHYFGYEDSELYTRWVQFGVFSPIMRLHSTQKYYHKREPWRHNKEVLEITRNFMQLRHQLIPYIYTIGYNLAKGEFPLVSPLYYYFKNENAYTAKNQYMFGSELMVAPFTTKIISKLNHAKKTIWFPEGSWYNFFTGERYLGNKSYEVYGTLDEMPVYAKNGAIIPLAKKLEENHISLPKTLHVHIFPFISNEFNLYEDDGISQKFEKNEFAITSFKMEVSNYKVTFQISKNDQFNLIDSNREINLIFRNVNSDIKITKDCDASVNYTKNNELVIKTKLTDKPQTYILENVKYTSTINYNVAITNMLDKTNYLVNDLVKIGYVADNYNDSKAGLLAMNLSALELIKQVRDLDIDNNLKQMVISKILLKEDQK